MHFLYSHIHFDLESAPILASVFLIVHRGRRGERGANAARSGADEARQRGAGQLVRWHARRLSTGPSRFFVWYRTRLARVAPPDTVWGLSGAEGLGSYDGGGQCVAAPHAWVLSRFRMFSRLSMISCITRPCPCSAALLHWASVQQFDSQQRTRAALRSRSCAWPRSGPGPSRSRPASHPVRMLEGVYVLPTAPSVGKPGRAGLVPPLGSASPGWPRSVLSHAAQTSATTARPGRVGAGLASPGHNELALRADARATSSSITDKEDGTTRAVVATISAAEAAAVFAGHDHRHPSR
jgi:hypothetical protein